MGYSTRKQKGQEQAWHPHMEWGRQMAYVNHFYFYLWDSDWGAAFWKTTADAPYPIRLWLNGHEWAKQQLQKIHLRYKALDNGFRIIIVINRPNCVLAPGLIVLDPKLPVDLKSRSSLATAWERLDAALEDFAKRRLLEA